MSISLVKKFYEMYENEEVVEKKNDNTRKRKAKKAKFNFKKAARIHDEAPIYEEVDHTEENLRVIQKLSVINSVKPQAVEKILEHEDRLKKKAKKEEEKQISVSVFSDRDFDTFEKEYLEK